MAVQTTTTSVLAKLGDRGRKAFEQHKKDDTKYGQARLPAGIENGVAQLVEFKFSTVEKDEHKGKPCFIAQGVVVAPAHHEGTKIQGLRTLWYEPLYDTPDAASRKTVEDHVARVLNLMRQLGVETAGMTYEQIDAAVAAIKKQRPCFSFRTWKGSKQTTGKYAGKEPLVNEEWIQRVEYTPQATDEVHDDTDHVEGTEAVGGAEANGEPTDTVEYTDTGDLDSLAAAADNGEVEAQAKIREFATAAGIADEVEAAESWAVGIELLKAAPAPEEEPAAEEPPEKVWKKGDMCLYKPLVNDPKTSKPYKAPVRCKVEVADATKKTASVKNMVDNKTIYKAVKWEALSEG